MSLTREERATRGPKATTELSAADLDVLIARTTATRDTLSAELSALNAAAEVIAAGRASSLGAALALLNEGRAA
jgi:hypothetical protein